MKKNTGHAKTKKNPRGAGRKKREGGIAPLNLSVGTETKELLRVAAEENGLVLSRFCEKLLLKGLNESKAGE